jgi:hypothetical protein
MLELLLGVWLGLTETTSKLARAAGAQGSGAGACCDLAGNTAVSTHVAINAIRTKLLRKRVQSS